MTTPYWERIGPGVGVRTPRADAPSNATVLSLSGDWRFRLSPTAEGTGDAFLADDFDDSDWDAIRVPSHWVLETITPLAGGPARSLRGDPEGPLYTNTALPIPLDPPRVPFENPTGDYRLEFEAPALVGSRAVLRFQGVDSCAKAWLNGIELGDWTGSRLQAEFEVTVRPGRNVLCVRVHRWSVGTYLEDQDMWWLPGIFRDVELIARPAAAIDDHHVHADFDAATGLGTLRVDARVDDGSPARVLFAELGIDIAAGETVTVPVEPWSADAPRLYRGTLSSRDESVELAVGFRRIEIVDGVLLANGSPLRFRGVNRHEHDQHTGRTLDRATMVRDIELMKQHNIDSVRTSHYPPHPEFLRLCDEFGLWVVEECDIETHGFIYAGWKGNPPDEPQWTEMLADRLERMVHRDKNHPSIVMWSMANESGAGREFGMLRQSILSIDDSRPVLYERDPSYRDSDLYAVMYPSLEALELIGRAEEPRPEGVTDDEDARRRTLPFVLVEYAHAMGNGPGSLQDYERILDAHPRLSGGFIWEWIDHGFARPDAPDDRVMHGGDVRGHRPNGGRYCLDGLVFADRRPSPALADVAKAYSAIRIAVEADTVTVLNHRHAADTSDLRFTWRLEADGELLAAGDLPVPVTAAHNECRLAVPPEVAVVAGSAPHGTELWLTIDAVTRVDFAWAPAGHSVAWTQSRMYTLERDSRPDALPHAPQAVPRLTGATAADEIALGIARFDARTGRLRSLGDLTLDGPWLDLFRAPTENDRGQGGRNDLAATWIAVGLDRLVHRTESVTLTGDALEVATRTAAAAHAHLVQHRMRWREIENGLELTVQAEFLGPWRNTPHRARDIIVPRLGTRWRLPDGYDNVTWFGAGPHETYVDSCEGARIGRYASNVDDLRVDYPTPQENGNRTQTRWLELSGADVPTLRIEGEQPLETTVRRWTSEVLAEARSPRDLVDSGSVWLNVDHRQQGLGSASVGPALPEKYQVPLTPAQWTMQLTIYSERMRENKSTGPTCPPLSSN